MPRQQVEFEFPDPDKETTAEIEVDIAEDDAPLEVEGAVGREDMKKPGKDTIKAGDVEIEIEDDTPEADRGRKASPPPQDVTDEELENYSEKVKTVLSTLVRATTTSAGLKKLPYVSEKL
jgi:hypothetical protein